MADDLTGMMTVRIKIDNPHYLQAAGLIILCKTKDMFTYYQHEISIPSGHLKLKGELTIPLHAKAIILFCQAAGNSRTSLRSRLVARRLQEKGFGTLLPDLLTPEETNTSGKQFDQSLLTARLMTITEWLMDRDLIGRYRLGYYASSTGAASALQAAAYLPEAIGAVVCRGGRPDLVSDDLARVEAPVLLIVGSEDKYVQNLNRTALERLTCERQLTVVEGVGDLFGNGKMEVVAGMTGTWFRDHLQPARVSSITVDNDQPPQ
jgi:dienelactone hydrolase